MNKNEFAELAAKCRRKIVIVGYPKSGNTWIMRLLAEALDCPAQGFITKTARIKLDLGSEGLERKSDMQVWKSHTQKDIFINRKIDVQIGDVIHMVRDPRDIAVSAYNFTNLKFRESKMNKVISIDEVVDRTIDGTIFSTPMRGRTWDKFVEEWLETDAFVLKYEQMLKNPTKRLRRILQHMNFNISPDKIKKSVSLQSFDIVRKKFSDEGIKAQVDFLHKGTAGQYKEALTKEQSKRMTDAFGDTMRKLGYET